MKTKSAFASATIFSALLAAPAFAQFTGFVNNVGTNSSDWNTAVLAVGGAIDTSNKSKPAPTGAINPGITFSDSVLTTIVPGSNPSDGNTSDGLLSSVEDQPPASNNLSSPGTGSTTPTFDVPVSDSQESVIDSFDKDIASEILTQTNPTDDTLGSDDGIITRLDDAPPSLTPVPEPSTYALFGVGFLGLLAASRRFRRKAQ